MKVFGIFCFIVCVSWVKSATVSGVTSETNAPTVEMTTADNGRGVTNTTDNADFSTTEITTTTINNNTTNTTNTNTTTQKITTPIITGAPTKATASTTSHKTEASSRGTPVPSAPTIPSPTTERTETSTSPQQQNKASQTGTIVGVAFGMLILGAILGVVGVYVFQRYWARGATGYELKHLQQY